MTQHDGRVFVLGAGFSKEAGHPLLAEFADTVMQMTNNPACSLRAEERQRFRNVVEYRHEIQRVNSYFELDVDNLEHIFSLIDMASSLATTDVERMIALREDLIFVLVKTLELTRRRDERLTNGVETAIHNNDLIKLREVRARDTILQEYRAFVQALRPHDVCITFNYDTVLEDALLVFGKGPDYGFPSGQKVFKRVGDRIRLLKLHGSVNFVLTSKDEVTVVDHELLLNQTDAYYQEGKPLLVPPTWNKGILREPLRSIWSQAGTAMANATKIYFIGYSLPDTDLAVRYLLANSLVQNRYLDSIRVVDPRVRP
jgi:hypothetical protein